jgi:hypothetical protein
MNDFSGTLGTGALVEWLESNIGLPFSCQFIYVSEAKATELQLAEGF